MSSALGMNLMPPTSAFQHGGSLQQPPNETPQPSENPTNNTNASELNNSSKDNHGKPQKYNHQFLVLGRQGILKGFTHMSLYISLLKKNLTLINAF